ncbi:uncharacterized protein LOC119355333 isoform X2 [Triticum dicoccoides]|uniref:uncharacterized protein LOC119355333 isoform X2 n=1 Tax=Triticum dicoccoides TaxID=85692 RepID=UPI00188EDE0D|nr:uncharacterized protein LOC119355333 isoform X2 [Triticum dicoccoides]
MAAAVFTPSHHGCRSTHGRSSKLQAWMDGFRKVSFLPGWSELQIPSGPPEPAISASSSPPPLGITSSPNASSAPSDRPQREIGHGGNKTARRCAFLQHIRRKKKQHEVPVDYLIGRAKCNRRSSSAATRQTPSKKDLPLSLLMGPQFVRNQIQPFDPLLFVGIIFKKKYFLDFVKFAVNKPVRADGSVRSCIYLTYFSVRRIFNTKIYDLA